LYIYCNTQLTTFLHIILDAETHEHTSPEYITTFETCTDNNQTFIKSKNTKIIKEHGAVIEETFDDTITHTIPQMPSEVLIEEIQGKHNIN